MESMDKRFDERNGALDSEHIRERTDNWKIIGESTRFVKRTRAREKHKKYYEYTCPCETLIHVHIIIVNVSKPERQLS